MVNVWRKAPFIRIVLFFIFGILSYPLITHSGIIWVCSIGTIAGFAYWLLHLKQVHQRFASTNFFSFLIYLFILCVGYFAAWSHDCLNDKTYFGHQLTCSNGFEVQLTSYPEQKSKYTKFTADVVMAIGKGKQNKTQGTCLLYIPKDTAFQRLKPGDHLLIFNRLQLITNSNSPGAFDYAGYCHQRQLYYQAFLRNGEVKIIPKYSWTLNGWFESASLATRRILTTHLHDTSSRALAEALLVGYRKNIDAETSAAFSQSGLAHIIAISGMHMALIYGSILWLLHFIPTKRMSRKTQIAIALIGMWLFAGLTGLPASVLRAAVMLSFVALGDLTQQRISSFNNLAASALFILCIDPNQIYDIGFQLSYLAVLSLILFQKKIAQPFFTTKKWLRSLWQLTASTLAAQILTLPVCLYYFHQFPLLFLLTNLVAIPITSLILYTEFLLICVSKISWLGYIIGQVITWLIHSLLHLIQWINSFEFATIQHIQLSFPQMCLLYGMICTASIFWFYRSKWGLYGTLLCWLGVNLIGIQQRTQRLQQRAVIIYQSNSGSYLEYIKGEHYATVDAMPNNANFIKYTQNPAHQYLGIQNQQPHLECYKTDSSFDYFQLKNTRLLRIKSATARPIQPVKTDYLVLSCQGYIDTSTFLQSFKPSIVVFDNQLSFSKAKRLSTYFTGHHIPIYHLRQNGSLLINL